MTKVTIYFVVDERKNHVSLTGKILRNAQAMIAGQIGKYLSTSMALRIGEAGPVIGRVETEEI